VLFSIFHKIKFKILDISFAFFAKVEKVPIMPKFVPVNRLPARPWFNDG